MPIATLAGRYDLLAAVGRGGFATVYRAHDRVMDRDVAVKVLSAEAMRPDIMLRFRREVVLLGRLEHPHILHAYDSGEWDGRPYVVTEFIPGETLDTRLSSVGALPIDDALRIAIELADALAFAHAAGVVHRDVKPANVLLGPGGVRLADFGVARGGDIADVSAVTSAGVALGTVQYMSPEQLCADPRIDGRADQYAFGLVAYEMFTGQPPHQATNVAALRALRMRGGATPATVLRPAIPEAVAEIIERTLDPMPADRWPDMATVHRLLGEVRAATPTTGGLRVATAREASGSATTGTSATGRRTVTAGGTRGGVASVGSVATAGSGVLVRRVVPAVGGLAVIGAAAWALFGSGRSAGEGVARGAAATDGPRVVDVRAGDGGEALAQALRDELALWRGVRLAEPGDGGASAITATIAVRPPDDSLRVRLSLGGPGGADGGGATPLTSDTSRVARGQLVRLLALRVVAGTAFDSTPGIQTLSTRSGLAVADYVAGWRAMRSGALADAFGAFARAADADDGSTVTVDADADAARDAPAARWAAQTGAWLHPTDPVRWRVYAERFAARTTATDTLHARALQALAAGDLVALCATADAWHRAAPREFLALFTRAECARLDRAVIPDAAGRPQFRASHWQALDDYQSALALLPDPGWGVLFERALSVVHASGNALRVGALAGAPRDSFAAFASLEGDSVAFRPVPLVAVREARAGSVPATLSAATDRERDRLLRFTTRWTAQAPSYAAWVEHARALELSGRLEGADAATSATAALDAARRVARTSRERAQLDVAGVRLAIRRGELGTAQRIAQDALDDSADVTPDVARMRAPLAALLGDAERTTMLLRMAARDEDVRRSLPVWATASDVPIWISDSLRAVGVRAFTGRCERLTEQLASIAQGIERHAAANEAAALQRLLLEDVRRAALPCTGIAGARDLTARTSLDRALRALAAGDSAGARAELSALESERRGLRPSSVAAEFTLTEAWLWRQLGDAARADLRVRTLREDLAGLPPSTFEYVPPAAALARLVFDDRSD